MEAPNPDGGSSRAGGDGERGNRALGLWIVLARATSAITARVQEQLSEHGLTIAEFGILEVLYHKGPLPVGEIQKRILVSSGGVTYLVDRLEAKGLVERKAGAADRRTRYAELTDAGTAFIDRFFPAHTDLIESLMSELSAEEQESAHRLMRRLGRSVAEDSTASPSILPETPETRE